MARIREGKSIPSAVPHETQIQSNHFSYAGVVTCNGYQHSISQCRKALIRETIMFSQLVQSADQVDFINCMFRALFSLLVLDHINHMNMLFKVKLIEKEIEGLLQTKKSGKVWITKTRYVLMATLTEDALHCISPLVDTAVLAAAMQGH